MTPRLVRLALCALLSAACATPSPVVLDGTAVSLGLTNRTGDTLCFLFVSAHGEDRWSDDLLGSASISAGDTRSVRVPRGYWDLRAENCNHELLGLLRGARITRSTTLVVQ
jgi:hypothetical protein